MSNSPGTGRASKSRRLSLAALLALLVLVATPAVAAAEYPDCRTIEADGTAGLDLRVLCTLGKIVGHYTGQSYESPADVPVPLLGALALGLGAATALAIVVPIRLARRWARPRRPADEAWWACGGCHSFNEPSLSTCYHCGAARPAPPSG